MSFLSYYYCTLQPPLQPLAVMQSFGSHAFVDFKFSKICKICHLLRSLWVRKTFQSCFLIFYTLVEYYEKDDFYGEEIDPDKIIYKDDPNAGTTKENDDSLEVVEDNSVSFWLSSSSAFYRVVKVLSFYKYFN